MLRFDYTIHTDEMPDTSGLEAYVKAYCSSTLSDCLFLDIETTGLKATESEIYLIGCLYYDSSKKSWQLRQFFCESFSDELTALKALQELWLPFSTILCSHGNRFEFSYLHTCFSQYYLPFEHWSKLTFVDLSQCLKPLRHLLGLSDLTRASMERCVGYLRSDTFSGRELAKLHDLYLAAKDVQLQKQLLSHNYEDLCSLLSIAGLLAFPALLKANLVPDSFGWDNAVPQASEPFAPQNPSGYLTATIPYFLPVSASFSQNGLSCHMQGQQLTITTSVFFAERKLFFHDYRNYVYLPHEDYAIHKSLASILSASEKQRATADTCYERHRGNFCVVANTSDTILPYVPILCEKLNDALGCIRYQDALAHPDEFAHFLLQSTLWYVLQKY